MTLRLPNERITQEGNQYFFELNGPAGESVLTYAFGSGDCEETVELRINTQSVTVDIGEAGVLSERDLPRDERLYVYHRDGLPCRRCGTMGSTKTTTEENRDSRSNCSTPTSSGRCIHYHCSATASG